MGLLLVIEPIMASRDYEEIELPSVDAAPSSCNHTRRILRRNREKQIGDPGGRGLESDPPMVS